MSQLACFFLLTTLLLDSSWVRAQKIVTEHATKSESQKINRVRIPSYAAESITRKTVLPDDIGIPGNAVLEVLVAKNGTVIEVRGITGDHRLVHTAKQAMMKWVFAPYLLNGDPVQFLTELTIEFDGKKQSSKLKMHHDPLSKSDR